VTWAGHAKASRVSTCGDLAFKVGSNLKADELGARERRGNPRERKISGWRISVASARCFSLMPINTNVRKQIHTRKEKAEKEFPLREKRKGNSSDSAQCKKGGAGRSATAPYKAKKEKVGSVSRCGSAGRLVLTARKGGGDTSRRLEDLAIRLTKTRQTPPGPWRDIECD